MADVETDSVLNDEDGDEALDLLRSILPNPKDEESNSRLQRLRDDHIQRLQTYRPENYFGMPIELSPLLCTLCGWEVQPQPPKARKVYSAVLSCRNCEAVAAVYIPQKLPAGPAKEKLIAHFQEQLWRSHQDYCMYQIQAKTLMMGGKQNLTRALARILPSHGTSLDLVVSATPLWSLIYERYTEMAKQIQKQPLPQNSLKIELPPHVQSYRSTQEQGSTKLPSLLLDRFRSFVREQEEENVTIEDNDAIALAALSMVVFGWDPANDDGSGGVHCAICRVQKPIGNHGKNTTTTTDWRQPLAAHRYFCPWVACHTTAEAPWWKVVVDSLLDHPVVSTGSSEPSSWLEVHRLLKGGLSKKRLKLRNDVVLDDC